MPKPVYGRSGSGMHTNMSLFRNGENVFYDPDSESGLSHIAYNFIAGIMKHEKLDKDRFRRDLGGVEEAYAEVMKRIGL